jgi:hypothetical protein
MQDGGKASRHALLRGVGHLLLLLVVVCCLAACDEPCATLEKRICKDLGADCLYFQRGGGLEQVAAKVRTPSSWRRPFESPHNDLCRLYASDKNYYRVTLPRVRYLARAKRDPRNAGPPPPFQTLSR